MNIIKRPFSQCQLPYVDEHKLLMGLDTEYQSGTRNHIKMGKQLVTVNQRRLEDIISIQLSFNYMNKDPVLYLVHRDPADPVFEFSDVIKLAKNYLRNIGMLKALQKNSNHFTLECWTFWGGVDLSVFKDYEKILTENAPKKSTSASKLVTIGGNTVFTSKPLKLKVRDKNRNLVQISKHDRLVIRDMTKLAPGKLNLEGLGDLINVPKIDTEQWDKDDGYPAGYYKSHMSELWQNRQGDFIDYALQDVIVTVMYGIFILKFQNELLKEGFGDFRSGQLKPSLGSIVATIVGVENTKPADWIVARVIKLVNQIEPNSYQKQNINKFLRTIVKPGLHKDGGKIVYDYHFNELPDDLSSDDFNNWLFRYLDFDKIRKGYSFPRTDVSKSAKHKHLVHDMTNKIDLPLNRMFTDAVAAYSGGYNVVQLTGILPAMGEKRDWDLNAAYGCAGLLIPDIAPGLGAVKFQEFYNLPTEKFDRLVQATMKMNGPYTLGVGIFDIEYPKDYQGFVITPKNIEGGPRYFRRIHKVPLTYTDAYNAWKSGAEVFTHRITFVRQAKIETGTLNGVSAEGRIQEIFQERRARCVHDSPQDVMNKNIVNTTYGTTAEGLNMKRSRDYNNNRPYYVPFFQDHQST